jgi:hypothetical protein
MSISFGDPDDTDVDFDQEWQPTREEFCGGVSQDLRDIKARFGACRPYYYD